MIKKSTMTRFIFITLILAIASTCVVGGTFAMYVTTSSGYSVVSVANWGITVEVGNYFADSSEDDIFYSYDGSVGLYNNAITIEPGSNGYYTFGWYGTSDVALSIEAYDAVLVSDEWIYGGYYGAWFDIYGEAYEPIKWALYKLEDGMDITDLTEADNIIGEEERLNATIDNPADTSSYTALQTAIDNIYYKYDAGTEIFEQYVVTWEWTYLTGYTYDAFSDGLVAEMCKYCSPYTTDEYYFITAVLDDSIAYSVGDVVLSSDYDSSTMTGTLIELPTLTIALTINATQLDSNSTIRDTDMG